jgi:hypothetical protein
MAHETRDLDAGQPHLTASAGVTTITSELSFHLLHSLDAAAAVPPQPTIDYFFGAAADPHQPAMQYEPLAPGHQQHTMNMLRDYCNGQYTTATEPFLRGARTGALVFGATDDESAAYMPGPFQSSPPPRATGGRKRSKTLLGGDFHGGPAGGVEKKEKQRRQRLSEKYNDLMLLIPNRTKVLVQIS